MIGSAFTIRNASDYDDMFIASKSDTQAQIENAEAVYTSIREVYTTEYVIATRRLRTMKSAAWEPPFFNVFKW